MNGLDVDRLKQATVLINLARETLGKRPCAIDMIAAGEQLDEAIVLLGGEAHP